MDVHGPRARLQSEVGSETLDESIDELAEFLDYALAVSAAGNWRVRNQSYFEARLVYHRLARVRRVLSEVGPADRPRYAATFLAMFAAAVRDFPGSVAEYEREASKVGGRTETLAHDRHRAAAGAAVTALTEWDWPAAVPAFAAALRQEGPLPVNRVYLLASLNVLLEGVAGDPLPAAVQARRLAAELLGPTPTRRPVPGLDAPHDERDWRAIILGEVLPPPHPTLHLRVFADTRVPLEDEDAANTLNEQGDALRHALLGVADPR